QDTDFSVAGYDITIGDLEVSGTFSAEGDYFGGGTLGGTIDTRPLVPLIDENGEDDYICTLATGFGAECTACPEDGEPYCLTVVADQIVAEKVEAGLEEIALEDCHADCADTYDDAGDYTNAECDLASGDTGR
ncbi:MAG: hypothetical protein QGG40_02010, partial [Myxococcota bacterium]|nr:hypothetical protein [Myxococcota bacterium]